MVFDDDAEPAWWNRCSVGRMSCKYEVRRFVSSFRLAIALMSPVFIKLHHLFVVQRSTDSQSLGGALRPNCETLINGCRRLLRTHLARERFRVYSWRALRANAWKRQVAVVLVCFDSTSSDPLFVERLEPTSSNRAFSKASSTSSVCLRLRFSGFSRDGEAAAKRGASNSGSGSCDEIIRR